MNTPPIARLMLMAAALTVSATPVVQASFAGTDVFIPSLGRGAGAASSQWNACIWVHNPNSAPVSVLFRLLLRDQPNPSPQVFADSIPPGDTRRYDDALATLFGVTSKTFGAVRVTTPTGQPVIVNARSYSVPAGGDQMDTVGQFYAAIPASFAIGPQQKTQLLGAYQTTPQNTSEFRYNYGFVETTGNQVTVQVTALDESGATVGSKSYTLGGYQASQFNITDLLPSVSAMNLRLEVQVTSGPGQVVAFGSGIANRSNDPSTFEMSFRDELLAANSQAGGLTAVTHDSTLMGDGTTGAPLGVSAGAITKSRLSASGGAGGQVLGTDGSNLVWQNSGTAGLSLPYAGSASGTLTAFRVENSTTQGNAVAVYGQGDSTTGVGVWGSAVAQTGTTIGVSGYVTSPDGVAVSGLNASLSGSGFGILGASKSPGGTGVLGYCEATSGDSDGIYGNTESSSGAGVFGTNNATTGGPVGVWGYTESTSGFAVYGSATATSGTNVGVYGTTNSAAGYAGYFKGDARVTGYLYKSGGGFQIDDPLDPAHKYLNHAFVESPEMKNVYDGLVVLDDKGEATVQLPAWFEALNESFRYQLTCVGGYAPVYIADEVSEDSFRIAGGQAGLKVSWQVTGVRKDAWAVAHRLPVEQSKPESANGTYLYPRGFGQPEAKEQGPAAAARIRRDVKHRPTMPAVVATGNELAP